MLPVVANLAWLASSWPAHRRFQRALLEPAAAQQRLLCRLLARHAASAYGRRHGFTRIGDYAAFAGQVPLATYDDLAPWITRIGNGEPAVLTSEPVTHFVPTSGSTGSRKLIPFTRGLQEEFTAAIGPWMMDLFQQHPSIAGGPAYWSVTPAAPVEPARGPVVPVGFEDDSSYLGGRRKSLVAAVMAAPAALRQVTDMETFRYLTLLCLLRRPDLRLVSIWHPSFLTLLLAALPGHWEELLADVATGRCRRAEGLPPAVCAALQARPRSRRARGLQAIGPARPWEIWPQLRVISCWGEAHAALGAADLARNFPGVSIQAKGLLATEGVVTVPVQGGHPAAVCSHFFEFIDAAGGIRRVHELVKGETYEVVMTTGGGLWRYRLGDCVTVTGLVGATPSLQFTGRAGGGSDRCGEKLAEAFAGQVIQEVCAAQAVAPRFALLAPEEAGGRISYTLFLEATVPGEIAGRLDRALRKNPHYDWCRDLGQLGAARVFLIQRGGYEAYVTGELARGRQLGEIKPRALSPETGWARRFEGKYLP